MEGHTYLFIKVVRLFKEKELRVNLKKHNLKNKVVLLKITTDEKTKNHHRQRTMFYQSITYQII